MSGELMRRVNGEASVRRGDKELVKKATKVKDEVELAAFMVEGIEALAAKIMDGVNNLEDHRRMIAGGDASKMALHSTTEAIALAKIAQIQRNLYNDWKV